MAVAGHEPGAATLGTLARGDPDPVLAAAVSQLRDYFAGTLTGFDLPLALEGTDFQRTVWAALQAIPYGARISYGELARRIGLPSASRAVGLANGRNPVSIVVPCHRVVGADGRLTGYGGGLDRKRFLLELEQRVTGQILA
jgi:methylated-DNA-[protein]-cysteine S-methyltransferase